MMQNMKIKSLVVILVLIPVVVACIFSFQVLQRQMSLVNEMTSLQTLVELSVKMSNTLHEQQKERGATAVFLGSKGQKFRAELTAQRKLTDEKRKIFEQYVNGVDVSVYGTEFTANLDRLMSEIGKMDNVRAKVDTFSISLPAAIKYYTDLNGINMDLSASMALLSQNAEITNYLHAYVSFLQSKERAGIERAVGAGAFAGKSFSTKILRRFGDLINIQDTYISVFRNVATDEQVEFYKKTMVNKATTNVERMRQVAFSSPSDVSSVDAGVWFKTITKKINLLKDVEDKLAEDLRSRMSDIEKNAQSAQFRNTALVVISFLITLIFAWIIVRSITVSLNKNIKAMLSLADGNLDVTLPDVTQNEMGEMAKALAVFKENGKNTEKITREREKQQKEQIERGEKLDGFTQDFENQINQLIATLTAATEELDGTAQSMTSIAERTSEQSQAMSETSQSTMQNIQSVAGAAEELSASIMELSVQVNTASSSTKDVVGDVEFASGQISGLSAAVEQIDDVITIIQDIAEQTNLLALNATIESARAGEAGKGFVVVANEVKSLAGETARATGEIADHIKKIQDETKQAVNSVGNIESRIGTVDEAASSIAAAIEQQQATTEEISRNTQVSSKNMTDLNENVKAVREAAANTGNSAGMVLEASQNMGVEIRSLQKQVASFLEDVKSA